MELMRLKKIELLAPVGDYASFTAAIENGANAIYLGGKNFSARAFATNFENEEIKQLIKEAHIKGVLVYIVVNTIVFEKEIKSLIEYLDFLYLNDADAFIVQDLGLIRLIAKRYPKIQLHVSTQQNVTSLKQVQFFESLGVHRIVLGRETDLSTIQEITQKTNVEIEVFAHGSLCVSYSGNCLHSSIIGKRSGNRGKCAQPCRMEYTLLEDNKTISKKKYLLSMKDLNTLESIDKIIQSGVTSLKIEGRMKSADYVALVTKTYKEAIDNYMQSKRLFVNKEAISSLKLLFNRDFTKGYINKEMNSQMTCTFRPNHLGKKIGKVISSYDNKIKIKLDEEISQKDKIVILQKEDVSFYLSKMQVKNKLVNKAYKNEIVEIEVHSFIQNGAEVYKCLDYQLMEGIQKTYDKNYKKIPIKMKFFANKEQPLTLIIKDYKNHSVCIKSEYIAQKALTAITSPLKVKEQLSKLGSTCYVLNDIVVEMDEDMMIPIKFLNDLRREGIEKLTELRENIHHRNELDIVTFEESGFISKKRVPSLKLAVKVHTIEQLQAIKDLKIDYIYFDNRILFNKAKKMFPQLKIIPSLSRIAKEDTLQEKTYLISQLGDIEKNEFANIYSDIYLNITNSLSASVLINKGVQHIGLSPELSKNNLQDLLINVKKQYKVLPTFEYLVYGRIQTMITKHCMIAKELGFERKHCNSCKHHQYSLMDRMNYQFPLLTDEDCNVTIYNSKAVHLIDELDNLFKMGIDVARLDFSIESPNEVKEITQLYLNAISHQPILKNLVGVTYGHFYAEDL